jgi:hypothetical protein
VVALPLLAGHLVLHLAASAGARVPRIETGRRAKAERPTETALRPGQLLIAAADAATSSAGVDNEDDAENNKGNQPCADPERLARKCHVLTSFFT